MNKATRQHVPGLTLPSYRRGSEATLESGKRNARRAEHYRQAKPGETAVSENRTKQARRAESSTARSNGGTAGERFDWAVSRVRAEGLVVRRQTGSLRWVVSLPGRSMP